MMPLHAASPVQVSRGSARQWLVIIATARASIKRHTAYMINVVRWPLFPLGYFALTWLAYGAAGREVVVGVDRSSFLLVGIFGLITMTGAVWGIGHAIQDDRYEGTIGAIFLSPASRIAILLGHGLGQCVILVPSVVVLGLLAVALGARFEVGSYPAVVLAILGTVISSIGTGILLAAVFVLSRRANLMANAIQHPLYLLGGFMVPRSELPGWLGSVSEILPLAHAVDATRASMLTGASLRDIAPVLSVSLALTAAFALIGALGLRRVEHAAKRTGQLELY